MTFSPRPLHQAPPSAELACPSLRTGDHLFMDRQPPRLSPPVFWALQAAATSGDGYRGQTSPHTPSEKFYGVTVFKALKVESILSILECGEWREGRLRLWGVAAGGSEGVCLSHSSGHHGG